VLLNHAICLRPRAMSGRLVTPLDARRTTVSLRLPLRLAVAALAVTALTPATAVSADVVGFVDVVATVGTDGRLWVRDSTDPAWAPLGGDLRATPSVVPAPDDVWFVGLGGDGNVWIRDSDPRRGWQRLGPVGTRCEGPSAVVSVDVLAVACRGGDGAVWAGRATVPADGSLPRIAAFRSLGGVVRHGAAVSDVSTGSTAQFAYLAVGADGFPYTHTASGWKLFATVRCAGPVSTDEYFRRIACRAPDGSLHATRPGWSTGYHPLGGQLTGQPGVSVTGGQTSAYYVLAPDGGLWRREREEPGPDQWRRFGGTGRYGVAAASLEVTDGT